MRVVASMKSCVLSVLGLTAALTAVAETPLQAGGGFLSGTQYVADRKVYELWRERLPTALVPRTAVKGHDRPRHVAFHLKGVKDVVLDFKGAEILLHGKIQPFILEDSTNVTIRNVSVRYARSPVTEGLIRKSSDREIRLELDSACPVEVRGKTLYFKGEGWTDGPIDRDPCLFQFFDGKTGRGAGLSLAYFAEEVNPNPALPWSKGATRFTAQLENGLLVLSSDRSLAPWKNGLKVGNRAVIAHAPRDHSNCEMVQCSGVTLENYRIVNGFGMGVFPFHCEDVKLDGLKVERNAADAIHAFACSGDFIVKNSVVEGMIDDGLNVHGNYYTVKTAHGNEIVADTGLEPQGTTAIFCAGDRISVKRGMTMDEAAQYTIVAVRPVDEKHVAFILDRPVSAHAEKDLVENLSAQCRLQILNSRFGKANTHLRLQTRAGVMIDDCDIELPVMLTGDATYWFESSPCETVVIRNSRFKTDHGYLRSCPEFRPTAEHPHYHGELRVENTTFDVKEPFRGTGIRSVRLPLVGHQKPQAVPDPKDDQWMIGCELLDRDFTKFSAYRDYLLKLGIHSIRLQGGWAKCERKKGRYDFSWLDEPVDFALAHGLNPVLETDYGNPLYKGGGGRDLAGGFPCGEEGLAAWDRWVDALSKHFAGRVRDWAMWNEPDIGNPADTTAVGGHHTPEAIAAFNVRTAKIIRKNIPNARIAGLSLATNDPGFHEACYKALGADIGLFWRFIYHGYEEAPEKSYDKVMALKAVCAKYAPHATLWQGENGAPSEMPGDGLALHHISWSEISQAKWDMRRMIGDYVHGVPSSVFTICDYFHPGRGIAPYGLLRADSERNVIAEKIAFGAVRNVVRTFDRDLQRVARTVSSPERSLQLHEFRRKGFPLFVFWTCGQFEKTAEGWKMRYQRPSDSFDKHPVVIEHPDRPLADPVWVDLLTGKVEPFSKDRVLRREGGTTYVAVPAYDSPCLLTERAAIGLDMLVPNW